MGSSTPSGQGMKATKSWAADSVDSKIKAEEEQLYLSPFSDECLKESIHSSFRMKERERELSRHSS